MSFVSDIVSGVADVFSEVGGAAANFATTNPAGMAITSIATGGFSGALGAAGGAAAGLSQGAAGLTSAFGGAASGLTSAAATGLSSIGGFGANFASKAIGAAGNIAPNFSTAASTIAKTGIGSVINSVSPILNTASNVYKAVNAINTLKGEKKLVNVNTTASQLGANWDIAANQMPLSVDAATISPIGANNDGSFASTSSLPPSTAILPSTTTSTNYLPMLILAGAVFWYMKGQH